MTIAAHRDELDTNCSILGLLDVRKWCQCEAYYEIFVHSINMSSELKLFFGSKVSSLSAILTLESTGCRVFLECRYAGIDLVRVYFSHVPTSLKLTAITKNILSRGLSGRIRLLLNSDPSLATRTENYEAVKKALKDRRALLSCKTYLSKLLERLRMTEWQSLPVEHWSVTNYLRYSISSQLTSQSKRLQ